MAGVQRTAVCLYWFIYISIASLYIPWIRWAWSPAFIDFSWDLPWKDMQRKAEAGSKLRKSQFCPFCSFPFHCINVHSLQVCMFLKSLLVGFCRWPIRGRFCWIGDTGGNSSQSCRGAAQNTERCFWGGILDRKNWLTNGWCKDSAFFWKKLIWTDAHSVVARCYAAWGSFLFVCRAIAATDLEEMAAVGFQGDSEAKYRRYTITTTRKYKHAENVEHVLGGVLQVQSVQYICSLQSAEWCKEKRSREVELLRQQSQACFEM